MSSSKYNSRLNARILQPVPVPVTDSVLGKLSNVTNRRAIPSSAPRSKNVPAKIKGKSASESAILLQEARKKVSTSSNIEHQRASFGKPPVLTRSNTGLNFGFVTRAARTPTQRSRTSLEANFAFASEDKENVQIPSSIPENVFVETPNVEKQSTSNESSEKTMLKASTTSTLYTDVPTLKSLTSAVISSGSSPKPSVHEGVVSKASATAAYGAEEAAAKRVKRVSKSGIVSRSRITTLKNDAFDCVTDGKLLKPSKKVSMAISEKVKNTISSNKNVLGTVLHASSSANISKPLNDTEDPALEYAEKDVKNLDSAVIDSESSSDFQTSGSASSPNKHKKTSADNAAPAKTSDTSQLATKDAASDICQPLVTALLSASRTSDSIDHIAEDQVTLRLIPCTGNRLWERHIGKTAAGLPDNLFACPVCDRFLKEFGGIISMLSCGHAFCQNCVLPPPPCKKACPLCRKPATRDDIKEYQITTGTAKKITTSRNSI